MFVGAHRDSEHLDGPLVETLGTLHRNAAITRVALHGITPQQAVKLMGAIAGREPDDAAVHLADVLHHETAGNPFFLTEMLRHLVEAGVIVELPDGRCTASAAVTSAGLPDSVREVLNARLARLGDQAAGVLAMAAVIGQEFDVDLLACTTQLDEDRLLDLLDAVVRTALVHEADERVGRYRFAHALVQHTLYLGLSTTRRTRAHARVATAMETLGGRASGELAYHYLAGITPATVERATHHARAAGEHALTVSPPPRPCAGTPPRSTRFPLPATTSSTRDSNSNSAFPSAVPMIPATAKRCSAPLVSLTDRERTTCWSTRRSPATPVVSAPRRSRRREGGRPGDGADGGSERLEAGSATRSAVR